MISIAWYSACSDIFNLSSLKFFNIFSFIYINFENKGEIKKKSFLGIIFNIFYEIRLRIVVCNSSCSSHICFWYERSLERVWRPPIQGINGQLSSYEHVNWWPINWVKAITLINQRWIDCFEPSYWLIIRV